MPGKVNALRLGDEACETFPRIYLDADVELTADSVRALVAAAAPARRAGLRAGAAAGPRRGRWLARRIHRGARPADGAEPGAGRGRCLRADRGRARTGLPDARTFISDDGWVHNSFQPDERVVVPEAVSVVRPARTVAGPPEAPDPGTARQPAARRGSAGPHRRAGSVWGTWSAWSAAGRSARSTPAATSPCSRPTAPCPGSAAVTRPGAATARPGPAGARLSACDAATYACNRAIFEFSQDSGPLTRAWPISPIRLRASGSSSRCEIRLGELGLVVGPARRRAASPAETRASRRSNETIGRDIAMYSMILFMVDTSLSGLIGSGERQTSAVDRYRSRSSSGIRPVNSTWSDRPSSRRERDHGVEACRRRR